LIPSLLSILRPLGDAPIASTELRWHTTVHGRRP
jgi:hypothetical protein